MTKQINLRRLVALLCLMGALACGVAACGSSSSSSPAASGGGSSSGASATATSASTSSMHLAKTKFVLHAGLAFGAFHRWIYKPLKAGTLEHPLTHKLTTVKAALAAGFVYHELKIALTDAQADPTLSKLVAPITAVQQKIQSAASGLKSGNPDTAGLNSVASTIDSIKSQAASAGQSIKEQTPAAL